MANQSPANPYRPLPDDGDLPAPFAGRQKAFEFLYQQLTDPEGTETSLILGRHDSGKTALLHQFSHFFDESFIGVYAPFKGKTFAGEADFLRMLTDGAARALAERNYTLSRLPEFEGASADMRGWFTATYLPEMLNIIRRHRRLVFLLDDADLLWKAIEAGNLPDDTFTYLNEQIQANRQLGLVLTLDTRYEADVPKLSPLVSLEDVFRLAHLSADETTWLMTEPAAGCYTLTSEAAVAVHRATGGQPRFLQRFGFQLFKLWESRPDHTTLTPDDVKRVTSTVYTQSEADLRAAWSETTRNERFALTAISSLIYADPLGIITPAAVGSWLVETDYPLDATAINAAIRGLEYREIAEHTAGGIRLTAGLMQTWLLENGRLDENAPMAGERRPALRWLAVAALIILALTLAWIASQGGAPSVNPNATAPPTVTLVTNP